MGIAVRTNVNMPLDLEESVWKYLTQEEDDIASSTSTAPIVSSNGKEAEGDQDAAHHDHHTRTRLEFVKRAEAIRKVGM